MRSWRNAAAEGLDCFLCIVEIVVEDCGFSWAVRGKAWTSDVTHTVHRARMLRSNLFPFVGRVSKSFMLP